MIICVLGVNMFVAAHKAFLKPIDLTNWLNGNTFKLLGPTAKPNQSAVPFQELQVMLSVLTQKIPWHIQLNTHRSFPSRHFFRKLWGAKKVVTVTVRPYNSTFQNLAVEFPLAQLQGLLRGSRTPSPSIALWCGRVSATAASAAFLLVEDLCELHPCNGAFPVDFAGHAGTQENKVEMLHQNASGGG